METSLLHGTVIHSAGGRVRRAVDRHGHEVWAARWNGDALHTLTLFRPDRSALVLQGEASPHPLFHRAHDLRFAETIVAKCGQTQWSRPTHIPPVDVPGALPSGAGSALLNWLSGSAQRSGASSLRYRGPYPTATLFDALTHSFRVDDPPAALERFTQDVESRAIRGSMVEVGVPFHPAPFEWHWPTEHVCVQLRDGLERVYIEGRSYALHQLGTRRLRAEGDRWVAYVDLGGIRWHDVLSFEADGTPVGPAAPLPAAPTRLLGQALPEEIVALLGAVLEQRAPRLLGPTVRHVLAGHILRWGDTADELARPVDGAIELHSAFGERLPEMDAQAMLAAFVHALEPVVTRLAQKNLAERHEDELAASSD
ncbi:MAG: hypothetical protein ACRBN8_27350 [Nannocystales bacterium]